MSQLHLLFILLPLLLNRICDGFSWAEAIIRIDSLSPAAIVMIIVIAIVVPTVPVCFLFLLFFLLVIIFLIILIS